MAKRSRKRSRSPDGDSIDWFEVEQFVSKTPPNRGVVLLQALLIVAAVSWVFWPVLHGDWLWYDDLYVTGNPLLGDPARLWKIWFSPGSFLEYHPIAETLQWMQWSFWGNATLGYHLTNVLLHLLSALLVWRLFTKFGLRLAWLGGLIFALHPAQVEAVAWIADFKNTLSLPPFLLAMCFYIDYRVGKKKIDYWRAVGLFLVAMLCNISMMLFPVVVLLYGWWRRGGVIKRDLAAAAPFLLISLALEVIAILAAVWYRQLHLQTPDPVPLGDMFSRVALAGLSISYYFARCFWPVGLSPLYPQWPVVRPSPVLLLPWLVLGVAIYWLWKRRRWGRHVLLGLGFFLINLAPFAGFKVIPSMSFTWVMDPYLYLPIIGLIGVVVAGLGQVYNRLSTSQRQGGAAVVTVVMALLAWESHGYAGQFINQETLWTYAVQTCPKSWMAHNNLGYALFRKGHVRDAIDQYVQSLEINPGYAEAHYNLGLILMQTGRTSEAMVEYERALRINPNYADAHNNLGLILMQIGREAEAIDHYQQTLKIKPTYVGAHNNLGLALMQEGRLPEAIDQFEQALKIDPDYIGVQYNLGNALVQSGRPQEAISHYEAALQINPNYGEVHTNLGVALARMGRLTDSLKQFEMALKLNPNDSEARNNLTRLQALEKPAPARH